MCPPPGQPFHGILGREGPDQMEGDPTTSVVEVPGRRTDAVGWLHGGTPPLPPTPEQPDAQHQIHNGSLQ